MLYEYHLFGSARRLAAWCGWCGWNTSICATALQGLGQRVGSESVVGDGNKQSYLSLPSGGKCPSPSPSVAHSYFLQESCLGGHGVTVSLVECGPFQRGPLSCISRLPGANKGLNLHSVPSGLGDELRFRDKRLDIIWELLYPPLWIIWS